MGPGNDCGTPVVFRPLPAVGAAERQRGVAVLPDDGADVQATDQGSVRQLRGRFRRLMTHIHGGCDGTLAATHMTGRVGRTRKPRGGNPEQQFQEKDSGYGHA